MKRFIPIAVITLTLIRPAFAFEQARAFLRELRTLGGKIQSEHE